VAVSAQTDDAHLARQPSRQGLHHREVRDFYAENGNRYNCYCSQIPVLLNDDGSIFNKGWLISWRKSASSGG
jgi:hypothetical protein